MTFSTRPANDLGGQPQTGVSIGLIVSATIASLRFCRTEDGNRVALGGMMTWGCTSGPIRLHETERFDGGRARRNKTAG
jgi:hypothetical protein